MVMTRAKATSIRGGKGDFRQTDKRRAGKMRLSDCLSIGQILGEMIPVVELP
jgi:hypothetical protein